MKLLLLGSGGREHALAWKIADSPLLTKLWCAPGNAGIAQVADCVALDVADHAAVIAFCKQHKVDLVMVGPEAPLAAGLIDDLAAAGVRAFGPTKAAAQLESSKGFTKDLCQANGIPTAAYERFREAAAAKAYVRARGAPIVVKADGLAAGKGVGVAAPGARVCFQTSSATVPSDRPATVWCVRPGRVKTRGSGVGFMVVNDKPTRPFWERPAPLSRAPFRVGWTVGEPGRPIARRGEGGRANRPPHVSAFGG